MTERHPDAAEPALPAQVTLRTRVTIFALLFMEIVLLALAGCTPPPSNQAQGYIEGEYVYVASPFGGSLTNLFVQRGAEVKVGQPLFELEHQSESAAQQEASSRLNQALSKLEDLKKGKRPTELAAIEARLVQARVALDLAEKELARVEKLYQDKVLSVNERDQAVSARDHAKAQVEELSAELDTGHLAARTDEIKAAESDVAALKAALAKAEWNLAQKSQSAPTNGVVHDTLFRQGEWVAAGNPVVVILPPTNIKVRFFVPEPKLANFKAGSRVQVAFDGGAKSYPATVNYISTQAEFTPPVIYSRESRAKLVYMIEAVFAPADATALRPGQPVDVQLAP